jgi:hypothetical protein
MSLMSHCSFLCAINGGQNKSRIEKWTLNVDNIVLILYISIRLSLGHWKAKGSAWKRKAYLMFCWPCIIVYQYSETNVMHFLFNLLRIKGLYMFRALLSHPQEVLHKRHLVCCVGVMSVGRYQDWSGTPQLLSTPILVAAKWRHLIRVYGSQLT